MRKEGPSRIGKPWCEVVACCDDGELAGGLTEDMKPPMDADEREWGRK